MAEENLTAQQKQKITALEQEVESLNARISELSKGKPVDGGQAAALQLQLNDVGSKLKESEEQNKSIKLQNEELAREKQDLLVKLENMTQVSLDIERSEVEYKKARSLHNKNFASENSKKQDQT